VTVQDAYPPPAKSEPHWAPLLVLAAAIALEVLLPDRLGVGPQWLLPVVCGLLLIRLLSSSPFRISGHNRARRRVSLALTAVASVSNGIALVLLCHLLLHHQVNNGTQLIESGGLIWLINVLLFSVWYWELDRGGPGFRAAGEDGTPDFLYPQMSEESLLPGWRPQFFDYLYLSLTNATAFSPTDTMPLSVEAKLIMGLQSLISLVTLGLVISRAVNIL
jgi:uncharacterized membrane protein